MPLNENLTWSEVGAIKTDSGTVSQAFQLAFGDPTKELLRPGTSLYKFNSGEFLVRRDQLPLRDESLLSPWWSPTHAFKHDAGLVQRQKIADANGVSFREWGRLTSVIKENWSSLDFLLTIVLKVEVYGWFGGFKSMARLDQGQTSWRDATKEARGRSASLPGGGTQFYIPNLTVGDIAGHGFRPI